MNGGAGRDVYAGGAGMCMQAGQGEKRCKKETWPKTAI
jgi:hypothetical protein